VRRVGGGLLATIVMCGLLAAACTRDRVNGGNQASQLPANFLRISTDSQNLAQLSFMRVTARSLPQTIDGLGSLTLDQKRTDHIGTIFAGTVTKVLADVGDRVTADQVLAEVHSHDLHEAVGAYRIALTEAQRTEQQVGYARRIRDRYQSLYEIKFASKQEAERAEMDYRNAASESARAQSELQVARAHLAGMLQLPERSLDSRVLTRDTFPIKSPRDGVVIARAVTPGMALQPGMETFTVSDLSNLWMVAQLREDDLHELGIGMPVVVLVRAFPNTSFAGRIALIGPEIDPTTRTLKVRILVPNADGRLKPEMFATARIEPGGSRQAFYLPEVSVQDLNSNPVVFVRHDESTFEARPVEIGEKINGQVEIVHGISANDVVAVNGSYVLKSELMKRSLVEE
jgi:membrane fusion protein, heavy metal efflux system